MEMLTEWTWRCRPSGHGDADRVDMEMPTEWRMRPSGHAEDSARRAGAQQAAARGLPGPMACSGIAVRRPAIPVRHAPPSWRGITLVQAPLQIPSHSLRRPYRMPSRSGWRAAAASSSVGRQRSAVLPAAPRWTVRWRCRAATAVTAAGGRLCRERPCRRAVGGVGFNAMEPWTNCTHMSPPRPPPLFPAAALLE